VVVAVGLTLIDPLADVDVNVPGVMAIVVAPLVAQLRVLLVPELMLAGFAVKDMIVGADPVPGDGFAEIFPPQLVRPVQASRRRTWAQRFRPEDLGVG
jgi:hypothetical protein